MRGRKLGWTDVILAVGLSLFIGGLALLIKQSSFSDERVELVSNRAVGDTQSSTKLIIDITGAVVSPGVYEMTDGDRVIDVLKRCGGLAEEADRDWVEMNINKARLVRDGEKIYIAKIGDVLAKTEVKDSKLGSQPVAGQVNSGLININTATVEQLDVLPGIGPALAGRIIDYREENNGFVSIEEVKLVSGIGDKVFEDIKDLITT